MTEKAVLSGKIKYGHREFYVPYVMPLCRQVWEDSPYKRDFFDVYVWDLYKKGRITDRDLDMAMFLYHNWWFSSEQARVIFWGHDGNQRAVRSRLQKLYDMNFLCRFTYAKVSEPDRTFGHIYGLGSSAAILLKEVRKIDVPSYYIERNESKMHLVFKVLVSNDLYSSLIRPFGVGEYRADRVQNYRVLPKIKVSEETSLHFSCAFDFVAEKDGVKKTVPFLVDVVRENEYDIKALEKKVSDLRVMLETENWKYSFEEKPNYFIIGATDELCLQINSMFMGFETPVRFMSDMRLRGLNLWEKGAFFSVVDGKIKEMSASVFR